MLPTVGQEPVFHPMLQGGKDATLGSLEAKKTVGGNGFECQAEGSVPDRLAGFPG